MGRSQFYFAYGSNMSAARMRERGLTILEAVTGTLANYQLVFNKKAADKPGFSYANIATQKDQSVQGVVYRLPDEHEIRKMDPFEGVPRFYSRDIFVIETALGQLAAWTYVANPAMLVADTLPPRAYIEHLLKGRAYLTAEYLEWIANHPSA